jgi:hypothetical protein
MADLTRTNPQDITLTGTDVEQGFVNDDADIKAIYQHLNKLRKGYKSAVAPLSPNVGDKWEDSSTTPGVLKEWDGDEWIKAPVYDARVSALEKKVGEDPSFRNKIINGNFVVNQRNKSGTVTLAAGEYGHDGWKAGVSGCTYTFATVENVTTLTITAGSLVQVIDGLNLQSGTHILSWSGTAQGKIGAGSYSASGVTGTATGGTNLPVEFGAGTLTKVQLEGGSISTPFEVIDYSEMLKRCKWIFNKIRIYNQGRNIGSAGVIEQKTVWFPDMRALPTVFRQLVGGSNVSTVTITPLTTNSLTHLIQSTAAGDMYIDDILTLDCGL